MVTLNIRNLKTTQADFWQQLETLLAWEGVSDDNVVAVVKDVIARIRKEGDAALVRALPEIKRGDLKPIFPFPGRKSCTRVMAWP